MLAGGRRDEPELWLAAAIEAAAMCRRFGEHGARAASRIEAKLAEHAE